MRNQSYLYESRQTLAAEFADVKRMGSQCAISGLKRFVLLPDQAQDNE